MTILLTLGISRLRYDHNLLNLQAAGLESVAWEHRLIASAKQSVWHAISIATDRDDLARRRNAFSKLDSVERVEDLSELIPHATDQKQTIIKRISHRLAAVNQSPPFSSIDFPHPVTDPLERVPNADLLPDLQQTPQSQQRLQQASNSVLKDRWQQLTSLQAVSSFELPTISDLPESLRARFVGHQGERLLRVYAKGNIWDPEALEEFITQIKSVDPSATGQPMQNHHGSHQMKRSYIQAAAYSSFAVLLVLWWDLRRPTLILLAAPLTLFGLLHLFGLMG